MQNEKQCKKCLQSLSLNLFRADARLKSGYAARCKMCHANIEQTQRALGNRIQYKYDPVKGLEYARRWREANRDKDREKANRRRCYLKQATPAWADVEKIKEIYKQAAQLNQSVDHIIPLSSKYVCGLNVHNNLQIIPLTENLHKSNKFVMQES